jgi:hypothetical protein
MHFVRILTMLIVLKVYFACRYSSLGLCIIILSCWQFSEPNNCMVSWNSIHMRDPGLFHIAQTLAIICTVSARLADHEQLVYTYHYKTFAYASMYCASILMAVRV